MTRRDSGPRDPHTAVLVEGRSDRAALEALAAGRGRDLGAEGIEIVAMGGASGIAHFLRRFGPAGQDLRLAGMCDAAEQGDFARGLARAGLGEPRGHDGLEQLGFFVCVADLEDELIRALGVAAVTEVVDALPPGQAPRPLDGVLAHV